MGPIEALRFALDREIQSIKLYRRFSQDYPAAKDMFLFLLGQEEKHKNLIEKKIHELTKF
jgi:rubrerythrin